MPTRMIKKRVGELTLVGYSVAGVESVVAAPELNLCFDMGRAPTEMVSIDTVCITHGHMDHAAGLAYYHSQRAFIGNPPGRVIVPLKLAQAFQALMAVWADIEGHHSPGEIVGVEAGQDVPIRRNLLVRPFTVNHGAAALGYSAIEVRNKLKPEYAGLSGPQLVELKKKGETIEHRLEVPLVTYCGDTALGAFLDEPHVCQAQVLIVECTFFDPDHVVRARAGRHLHVCDMPELMSHLQSPHVVLTHVSQRTDMRVAKQMLADTLNESDLARTTFLMDRPPRKRYPRSAEPTDETTTGATD
ncbi:MAG: hypothetical protein GY778_21505 [bacterium]|nr:hypothetical protein [bacterium]